VCSYGQIPSNTRITPDDNSCNPCNLPFVPDSKNKVNHTTPSSNKISAYYSYLTCNDTLYVSLSEIYYSQRPLTPVDFKFILGKAIRAALAANPGLPNPSTIKVVIPSCWTDFNNGTVSIPCSYTDCCTFNYTLYTTGTLIYVSASSYVQNSVTCGTDCISICGSNYLIGAGDYLAKVKTLENNTESENNLSNKLLVKPNPSTGLSTIEIESESMGRLTLKLLDLQGREVQKIDRFKSGKSLSLQLDGTNLAQGTYTLQLIIENQVIATTNLIIQK